MQRRIVRAINRENVVNNHHGQHTGPKPQAFDQKGNELRIAHKAYVRRMVRRQNRRDAYNRKILRSKTFFAGIIKSIRKLLKGDRQ